MILAEDNLPSFPVSLFRYAMSSFVSSPQPPHTSRHQDMPTTPLSTWSGFSQGTVEPVFGNAWFYYFWVNKRKGQLSSFCSWLVPPTDTNLARHQGQVKKSPTTFHQSFDRDATFKNCFNLHQAGFRLCYPRTDTLRSDSFFVSVCSSGAVHWK